MKDLEENEHLCSNCERERRELNDLQMRRLDAWKGAMNAMKEHDWPEDGAPTPSDVLHLALFLDGLET